LLILLNPQAHSGRAGQRRAEIEAALSQRGLEATIVMTDAPGQARALVEELPPGAHQAVVAAGGDGTLFEVVNGLMARPPEQREALGLLPMGTGNAFARDLGLAPGAVEDALDLLAAGHTAPADVVEAECDGDRFHFINMLGLGLVTEAARTGVRLKWLGRGAYTAGALFSLLAMPALALELELDDERLALQDGLFLQIANSRYTGTHFKMAPDAEIDDGLLDVVLVRHLPRHRALRLFPAIYDWQHTHAREVSVHRVRRISVLGPAGLGCAVDGEFRGTTPLTVTCLPGAIRLFSPAKTAAPIAEPLS
jgi:YegS/Rv2252/BmrU family lipid kinase